MKRVVLIAASLITVLAACAVREAQEPEVRRAARKRVPHEPAGYVQEGIAGVGMSATGNSSKGLTAAHKTLPMDLLVRVRNKENGRSAIVRIAERGPFVKGRILDLSPAAKRRLGIQKRGAVVRVEALGFRENGPSGRERYRRPESYDAGNFSVQIKVYSDAEDARRLASEMQKLFGYSEIRAMTAGSERYYGVCAGKFSSLKDAETAERNFAQHGYPGSFIFSLE